MQVATPKTLKPRAAHRGAVSALLACMLGLLFVSLGARVSPAQAQSDGEDANRAAARRLGTQGIEAYWANDFSTANDKLDRAFRLYATPTLGLWSARARLQLGQLIETAERLREAIRADTVGDAEAQVKAQQEARAELDQLVSRIPTLTIHIKNARADDVVVTLDNEPIPSPLLDEARPTNPGELHVVVTRGNERYERRVYLGEGKNEQTTFEFRKQSRGEALPPADASPDVTLAAQAVPSLQPSAARLHDQPEPSASPLQPIGIIVLSFGGASLATAGVTALIANGKRGDCPDNVCAPDVKSQYDSLRTVSTVAFYAGAALAVSGAVMWLVAPNAQDNQDAQASRSVGLRIGPGAVGISGAF